MELAHLREKSMKFGEKWQNQAASLDLKYVNGINLVQAIGMIGMNQNAQLNTPCQSEILRIILSYSLPYAIIPRVECRLFGIINLHIWGWAKLLYFLYDHPPFKKKPLLPIPVDILLWVKGIIIAMSYVPGWQIQSLSHSWAVGKLSVSSPTVLEWFLECPARFDILATWW